MGNQIATLLPLVVVPAFLARFYYRWQNDFLRKLRGPDSSSLLYGRPHPPLLVDSPGPLVAQETILRFSARMKWGIASSNGRVNMAMSGDSMGALAKTTWW
ncbi:hypothetical protein EDB92DRAFT_690839 [Lactarius akahatsu]|uniref:Uncharacterized protein n=1 Tax=Lactarius akahatsu TaxID=416441 RepID=A0AAD4Q4U7_9AGAM|nr:hypothetical protein EDB92DRAFT_690839 [Lactarius akahatsu]